MALGSRVRGNDEKLALPLGNVRNGSEADIAALGFHSLPVR